MKVIEREIDYFNIKYKGICTCGKEDCKHIPSVKKYFRYNCIVSIVCYQAMSRQLSDVIRTPYE